MPIFSTRITRNSLTWSPFSSESMMTIGSVTLSSITTRMTAAIDITDSPSKPLAESYARRKMKKNRAPVRDWTMRGLTMRSLKVKSASENRVTIGPVSQEAVKIISARNRVDHMWGMSAKDTVAMRSITREVLRTTKMVRWVRKSA